MRFVTARGVLPVLLLASLLLAACVGPGAYATPPRVSLVGLAPVEVQLLEQRYRVRLRVQNPNDRALRIRGLDYTIDLNDQAFASGVSDDPVTIPAYGESTIDLEVTSSLARLIEQLRAFGEAGAPRFRYRLHGGIALEGALGKVPFDYSDEIDFGGTHRSAPGEPRAI